MKRLLLLALIAAGGCRGPLDTGNAGACPQTYEFGNYGCTRIVVLVEAPPQPWPERYIMDVRAVPAREALGTDVYGATSVGTGVYRLNLTRWRPAASSEGDTVSVWVTAKMLEDPRPVQVGVPLPTFAADSVLRVVRVAPVGERAPVDTVKLVLRRR